MGHYWAGVQDDMQEVLLASEGRLARVPCRAGRPREMDRRRKTPESQAWPPPASAISF